MTLFRSYSTIQVCRPNELKALKNFGLLIFTNQFSWVFRSCSTVHVRQCNVRSSSIVHVYWCNHFSVTFQPIFGHIDPVKITSLKNRAETFFPKIKLEVVQCVTLLGKGNSTLPDKTTKK